jgi:hypothetical protein
MMWAHAQYAWKTCPRSQLHFGIWVREAALEAVEVRAFQAPNSFVVESDCGMCLLLSTSYHSVRHPSTPPFSMTGHPGKCSRVDHMETTVGAMQKE